MKQATLLVLASLLATPGFAAAPPARNAELDLNGNYLKWGSMIYWADGTQCHKVLGKVECTRNNFRLEQLAPARWKNRYSERLTLSEGKLCTDFRNDTRCRKV
jgi:hypothetical protein